MSVINDAQMNCVCALSVHSYFCLNTAQYIQVACVGEVCEDQWGLCAYGHQTLQTACSYRGTTDGVVNSE